jgi:small-conductance mechanosensitive channel
MKTRVSRARAARGLWTAGILLLFSLAPGLLAAQEPIPAHTPAAGAVPALSHPGPVVITPAPARLAAKEAARAEERTRLVKKLIQTLVIVAVGYLLIFMLVGIVNRQVKDLKVRHLVRKNISYLITVLMILYILFLWAQNIGTITIFLGVASVGIALALQEVILCVAGWFHILLRRPFEVGDRIELGGIKGDVIDIRLFQTSLLEIGNWVDNDQSTGRIANVPNSAIFKKENYNYNRGFEFIWNEMKVLVTYESDWKRAEEIMLGHARRLAEGMEEVAKRKIAAMTRHYMIRYDKLTPIVYVAIKESGIELTLRYLTEAKQRRSTQDSLSRAMLEEVSKEPRISFAYPTHRIVK